MKYVIYFLTFCPILVHSFLSFSKRYENKLKSIFGQLLGYTLVLNVEPENQILKVIYYIGILFIYIVYREYIVRRPKINFDRGHSRNQALFYYPASF